MKGDRRWGFKKTCQTLNSSQCRRVTRKLNIQVENPTSLGCSISFAKEGKVLEEGRPAKLKQQQKLRLVPDCCKVPW